MESPPTEASQWLASFDGYLSHVLGLSPASRKKYYFFVRRFLDTFCGVETPDWSLLRAEHLTAFVHQEASRLNGHARKSPITAIRTLLRFLVCKGEVRSGLEAAIPVMPQWKQAALPMYLPAGEVERIVASTLDESFHGLRDHAILLLLARLGLRANEIVRLTLDDINWIEGYLLIRAGKSRRERRLPLLQEVGVALCAYLQRGRPHSSIRNVFLQMQAPFGPFQDSSAVAKIVRRAMASADISAPSAAAHLLRHTVATRMVCNGVSFKEVADILGHASLETTAIYAKLDLVSHVALPWPGDLQ